MPKREWAEETRPMYEYGYVLGKNGLDSRDRDIAVVAHFGNVAAYLDAACEGYYDAREELPDSDSEDDREDDGRAYVSSFSPV
jgi:hypothetical protein